MVLLKNPYGIREGRLLRVEDVERGLACGCRCPNPLCNGRLVAKNGGTEHVPHFAHYQADENCGTGYESALHLMAKDVLQEHRRLMLPQLRLESSRAIQFPGTFRRKREIVRRQTLILDSVDLEVWMDGRIPDVVASRRGRRLLIELVVTHGITPEKFAWIRQHNIATIQYDLSRAAQAISEDALTKCLITGYSPFRTNIVSWVFHPGQAAAQNTLDAAYLKSLKDGIVNGDKTSSAEQSHERPDTANSS